MTRDFRSGSLTSVALLGAGLVAAFFAAGAVTTAQMHQGHAQAGQMGTHQHGAQAGQMGAHQHGAQGMQGTNTMMSAQQMMQNADTMMKNAAGHMQGLSAMSPGTGGMGPGSPMATAMQGMLDHMRQLQGSMNEWMKNPQAMHDAAGMKSFQEACGSFEQMARAFEAMTKHMNDAAKGPAHGAKR